MKKRDISEELWFRYLEGKTNEEEAERVTWLIAEDDELLAEYLSVREAMQLTDTEPNQTPDLNLAKEQISQVLRKESPEENKVVMLPRRTNLHRYIAIAAAAALLVSVALFLLFRPDHNDNSLAQQEKPHVETEAKTQSQSPETTVETEQTNNTRKDNMPAKSDTEGVKPESHEASAESYTTQKLEKNYAAAQVANHLTVTKPAKDNYRVLCKNLEKTLNFEWSATNVKTLHFTVTDSKGKNVAGISDKTVNQYALKYKDVYPEKQLKWTLSVAFEDGTQETRTGRISIDYEPNTP
ncbi:MAG: hypothetical protein J6T87_00930 [Bacteroidales bacterium]|nr:hypothetical protein [Bacteroidales bacterium]